MRRATLCTVLLAAAPLARAATFTTADVAKHATKSDCWIIIEKKVYDVTRYVDKHPAPPSLLTDACGKDATEGWRTKGKEGKPHSKKAAALLETFFKGDLAGAGG